MPREKHPTSMALFERKPQLWRTGDLGYQELRAGKLLDAWRQVCAPPMAMNGSPLTGRASRFFETRDYICPSTHIQSHNIIASRGRE